VSVEAHTIELAGSPVFYRAAPIQGTPTLYLHGVPASSDDWIAFLERTGGVAPDLPGFGRTGKGGHLDFSLGGQAEFLERLLAHLGLATVNLVAHDWGAAIGEAFVQRDPTRVNTMVLISPFPGLQSLARWWRRPLLGEFVMGATTKRRLTRELRKGGALSGDRLDAIWEQFDQGTQRAILRLYRSAPEWAGTHGGAGEEVGGSDPWRPPGHKPTSERAGHWPWLEDPAVIERVGSRLQA
jgi:pimeloyl-ACP methyl ester carboxylesterase